jgi:hypothetical protein
MSFVIGHLSFVLPSSFFHGDENFFLDNTKNLPPKAAGINGIVCSYGKMKNEFCICYEIVKLAITISWLRLLSSNLKRWIEK